jgi:hypothetical protein
MASRHVSSGVKSDFQAIFGERNTVNAFAISELRMPRALSTLIVLCGLILGGCGGSLTQEVKGPPAAPAAETARVYFVLDQGFPSGAAYVVEGTKLLGFVENGEHFIVDLPPGEHLFMLLSGQDEAMKGTLEAGKTYHIKLYVTPGVWGTRVYWTPLKATGEDLASRKEGVAETERVELVPEKAFEWEKDEREDLERRDKSFRSGEDEIGQVIGPEHGL